MPDFQVFDGHNDFLYRLQTNPERRYALWPKGDGSGHLDLPRMRKGGFVGGFFAIYIPSPEADPKIDREALMNEPTYDFPLDPLIDHVAGQPFAWSEACHFQWMERAALGAFRICRTGADVRAAIADDAVAGILHMEGAEAIDPDLEGLYLWHAAGLCSIGPVWSRPTIFGHGVPFRFPGTPDTGDGLTDAGKRLVRACDRLGIQIDLSHLNEKGFDDVARISSRPMVATHSNAYAHCPSTRNLTDRQLKVIAESDGIVGLNFATIFLRPDGRKDPMMDWGPIMRHLDHLVSMLGESRVGFGSDFDGATMPEGIGDVAGLPALCEAMLAHGFGRDLVAKIARENWLSFLDRNLR